MLYVGVCITWAILCAKNWHDLLRMQHIITAVLLLVSVEHFFLYGYFSFYNTYGNYCKIFLLLYIFLIILIWINNNMSFSKLFACHEYNFEFSKKRRDILHFTDCSDGVRCLKVITLRTHSKWLCALTLLHKSSSTF